MNPNQFSQLKCEEANNLRVRVELEHAKQLLLNNKSVIVGGTVRYFRILELGLGVYEVGLAEISAYDTKMADNNYIPSLKEDGTRMFPRI